jgi:DNA-binding transcriptional ArsR family regulator
MLNNERIDAIFHALGEPTRRAMLDHLSQGPVSVTELSAPLPVSLAAVIQHLQVLEECGVVKTEKVGRVRTCSIAPEGLCFAERWLSERRNLWERRLDRLGDFLREEENAHHRRKKS